MNILFVYGSPLIPSRGGTERVTCTVADALKHSTKALFNAISNAIQTAQYNKDHMEEVAAHLSKFDMNKLVDEWQHLLEHVTNSENNA